MTAFDEPLRRVLAPKTAKVLAADFGMQTAGDLLRHYPRRYAERGELTDLAGLRDGEHVTVLAEVAYVRSRRMRQRRGSVLDVTVTDGSGTLSLTFFGRTIGHEKTLLPGRRGLFAGKVSTYQGKRQLAHPEYHLLDDDAGEDAGRAAAAELAAAPIPVYPATKNLASWKVAQAVRAVLDPLRVDTDPLPAQVRDRHELIDLGDALRQIHRPADRAEIGPARTRLKWDEAFVLQAALAQRRIAARAQPAVARPRAAGRSLDAFDAALPFTLTEGQREVGELVGGELAGGYPMHRLLQGEVGSGKTVVALRAMLQVVDAGGQAALLAPTEVLAQQHHRSICELLGPLGRAGALDGDSGGTRVALLTGSQGAAQRRTALLEAASGAAGIVVGTHALLTEHVQFADLGLVVVDEQHRFGVEQRDALREKATGGRPHVLVMTATPIPRTVAMTVYGDLDVATLTELPAGRSPIATHVVPAAEKPHYLDRAWQRVREEVTAGHQAYVVCPRIGGDQADDPDGAQAGQSPEDDAARRPPVAVSEIAPTLTGGPLRGLRVAVLHGRLPPADKDAVMRGFAAGELDVLVATTVIEVGVDVPNAAAMVIMDADRFGVSQLHQLRGRIGRGSVPGIALLVTEAEPGTSARERLDAVAATADGFELSRVDLAQRREGDVLGAAQAGRRSSLKMLTLLRDEDLIKRARGEANALVEADPELHDHPELAAAIAEMLDAGREDYLEKT